MKTFLCSHLVTVRWRDRETSANLERICRDEATVNAEEPVPVGEAVTIHTGVCLLPGTVARCTMEMSGHEIDVALEQTWSPDVFMPDHLFDPDVMLTS
jgi:hypothetical protein